MFEVLRNRTGFDLIFSRLDDTTINQIPSIYHNLNNYGFWCISICRTQWQKIPDLILISENIKVAIKQEKNRHTYYEGLKFYELYVRENLSLLVLRKIVPNENKFPCPKCLSKDHLSKNGYSKERVISWECKNPDCHKSVGGRGHRFSEITEIPRIASTMCESVIQDELINKWRRDIEQELVSEDDLIELCLSRYSFPWSKVSINETFASVEANPHIEKLAHLEINTEPPLNSLTLGGVTLFNGDSKTIDYGVSLEGVNVVYTSPPYYNAREYSEYSHLFEYLLEMKQVFLNILNHSSNIEYFFINIGDIVCKDKTYSSSFVRKKYPISFMLSYYLRDIGIYLKKIYFWDKGEPQSKRHLNANKTPVYNKPLNAFEYVLVFTTQEHDQVEHEIVKVNPVIKINNKGINTVKHTAPYPSMLIEQTLKDIDVKGILDPFLGSGTTAILCTRKKWNCVGVELNEDYYKLSCENVFMATTKAMITNFSLESSGDQLGLFRNGK